MKPLFFGSSQQQLFGIYHPPLGSAKRTAHGVLLCYPGVQEYNTSHWAFRRLASLLTRQGFHVFRFDYFGTGDSAGQVREGRLPIWVENIREAASELADVSGARTLSVVGMRLGAVLAHRACAQGLTVKDLVLWEPVVSGRDYLEQLEGWDRTTKLMFLHSSRTRDQKGQLFGYPCPPDHRNAISEIDLCRPAVLSAQTVRVVVSNEQPEFRKLRDAIAKSSANVTLRVVSDAAAGAESASQGKAVLSNEILLAITEELSGGKGARVQA